jgi:S-adenosyl-L-methionine hydrolase (adenosine-forming)
VSALITLTTDFGLTDNFVGVMKGVIAGIAPDARVIDLSHGVPAQDVRAGAFVLATGYEYFPPGTVHVAVVDPGVGSSRGAVAVAGGGWHWVAPDNGVLSYALAALGKRAPGIGRSEAERWHLGPDAQAVALTEPRYWLPALSQTFHGRDVFAPVAAHLARGVPLSAFGPSLASLVALPAHSPEPSPQGWRGRVIYVDRFGNLITDVGAAELGDRDWIVTIGERQIEGLSASYTKMGEVGAILGSTGYLEIAAPNRSAAALLHAGIGTALSVEPLARPRLDGHRDHRL